MGSFWDTPRKPTVDSEGFFFVENPSNKQRLWMNMYWDVLLVLSKPITPYVYSIYTYK